MINWRKTVSSLLHYSLAWLSIFILTITPATQLAAQNQSQTQSQSQKQQQTNLAAPPAGGPDADTGVIAIPKKKQTEQAPPAPATPKITPPKGMPSFSMQLNVPEVTVDVGVLIKKTGQFVPNLQPDNFRIYENGVLQKVIGFRRVQRPITALLLCEFASNSYYFIYDMRNAAFAFANQLRPKDYVALMTFDLRTHIVTDFTQNKSRILDAINSLQIPGFSETDLFDALYEAEDRLSRVQGRKYIILIASGRDTFSRITYSDVLKKIKSTPDVTIYTISTGGWIRAMTEGQGGMWASMRDLDYLQADNEMRTFAKLTGGMSFFPRFQGALPDIFSTINRSIRSKYELVYHPTDAKQDGTYRKLRVELVDSKGRPLRIVNQKHKPLKYEIIARDGYRAKQEVE